MEEKLGKVIIAPSVLTTIVRLTALSQPGVRRMASALPLLERVLGCVGTSEGVRLAITDGSVIVDLYIIADASANMRELGETLQREVARAVQDMVGMSVRQVNVHIDGIEFTSISGFASSSGNPFRLGRSSGRSNE
jgi:uncharacterized alkaline shock family protein YloU